MFLDLFARFFLQTLGDIDRRLEHLFVFFDAIDVEVSLINYDVVGVVETRAGLPLILFAHFEHRVHQIGRLCRLVGSENTRVKCTVGPVPEFVFGIGKLPFRDR